MEFTFAVLFGLVASFFLDVQCIRSYDQDVKNTISQQDRRGSEFTDDPKQAASTLSKGETKKRGIFLGKTGLGGGFGGPGGGIGGHGSGGHGGGLSGPGSYGGGGGYGSYGGGGYQGVNRPQYYPSGHDSHGPSSYGSSGHGYSFPTGSGHGSYGSTGIGGLGGHPTGHGGAPYLPPTGHGIEYEHGGGIGGHGGGIGGGIGGHGGGIGGIGGGLGGIGGGIGGHGGHSVLAFKKLLIPLAGIALLGAAAALSTNPVLLQLGVLNGRKRRRRRSITNDWEKPMETIEKGERVTEAYPQNPFVMPTRASLERRTESGIVRNQEAERERREGRENIRERERGERERGERERGERERRGKRERREYTETFL